MCLFCAAIPSVLAVGAAVHGQQREAARRAEIEGRLSPAAKARLASDLSPKRSAGGANGGPAPKPARMPVAKVTTALVVMLVTASVVYHTQSPV